MSGNGAPFDEDRIRSAACVAGALSVEEQEAVIWSPRVVEVTLDLILDVGEMPA